MNVRDDSIPSFMQELILNKEKDYPFPVSDVTKIKPEEGFCLKAKDVHGNKVFINFCHSMGLPAPKDIDEDELNEILTNPVDDKINYRVPISLGEAKDVIDKSGVPCTAHDVVVNSEFFAKMERSYLFKNFVIQVAFEGLEDKCKVEFKKEDWIILKNKKYMGTLGEVTVRTAPKKALITELSSGPNEDRADAKRLKFEEFPPPEYEIIRVPAEGRPKQLVATFRLPLVLNSTEIQLDLGEDRIVMCVPNKYFLDIFLPYYVNPDLSKAELTMTSMNLTLTMPISRLT